MVRHWLLGMLILGFCVSTALARQGVVRTKDGRNIEGDVIEKENEAVTIVTKVGTVAIAREDIATIDYAGNIREAYKKKLAELPKDAGAKAHLDIAKWLYEAKEYELARAEVDATLVLDPNNAEAAILRQTVERTMLWQRAKLPSGNIDPKTTVKPPASQPSSADKRFLAPDQINVIRQAEIRNVDRVRVKLANDVGKRYIDYDAYEPKAFAALSDAAKALLIFKRGTAEMRQDVKILEDPIALAQFKRQVQPTLLVGCASVSCHGGTSAGSFVLHSGGANDAVTYTNFYILTQYKTDLGDAVHKAIDRVQPRNSLILQYGLPREQAEFKHPAAQGWASAFRGQSDPKYLATQQWLGETLIPIQPDYRIEFTVPTGKSPATQPAKTAPKKP